MDGTLHRTREGKVIHSSSSETTQIEENIIPDRLPSDVHSSTSQESLNHSKISYKDRLLRSSPDEKIMSPRRKMDTVPSAHRSLDHPVPQKLFTTTSCDSADNSILPHVCEDKKGSDMMGGVCSPRLVGTTCE